jgi:hypothetical protein
MTGDSKYGSKRESLPFCQIPAPQVSRQEGWQAGFFYSYPLFYFRCAFNLKRIKQK